MRVSRMVATVASLAALAQPGTLLADVLEIGGGESRWVAGGPQAPESEPEQPTARSVPAFAPLNNPLLSSRFGMRMQPILGFVREHRGVDFAAPVGTPIYATADGQVSASGVVGGYGLMIQIDHPSRMQTRYGHLSRLAVRSGQAVSAGQLIGYSGDSGLSTGPHLHYEVRLGGVAVDPVPYMRP